MAERTAPPGADAPFPSLGGVPAEELVLTTAARSLRRALGPTAWVVLEELTSLGSPQGEAGVVVVVANLRDLAESVGLGRDAVAGALQALALAGWVRSETARGAGGRFGVGRYLVSTNPALRRLPGRPPARPPRADSPTTIGPQRPHQLSLLEFPAPSTSPNSPDAPSTP